MDSSSIHQHQVDIPVGPLGIIGMKGCEELTGKVDAYLADWRKDRHNEFAEEFEFRGYQKNSFLIPYTCPRFGSGEAKGVINQSTRGQDIYIITDCFNYGVTYKMYGMDVPMSPDDHFQDLKRIIAAIGNKARRINVIMPMLYEGRQHKRTARESLDCAMMLQELVNMGIENFVTFDAHDPRVQNAVPLSNFENIHPTYQFLKALLRVVPDMQIDKDHLMIISPDEGGMGRCVYYSSVLGVDMGLFYKRRDYSTVVNGKNPIVAHEFLGDNIKGKDLIIVDDMISSGESVLDICEKLKARGAKRIFVCTSFGLFTDGYDRFDAAYEKGWFDQVFTTNLIYRPAALDEKEWYTPVDMSKYIAYIIDALNHDQSMSTRLNPNQRIHNLITRFKNGEYK